MNTLTQEQLQELSPEAQVAIANMALLRLKKHKRLFNQLRRSSTTHIITQIGFLLLALIELIVLKAPLWAMLTFAALVTVIGTQGQMVDLKFKALIEILEDERST